jgi:hypothetical protein
MPAPPPSEPLAPLLAEIRRDMAGTTERKPGTFYRKRQACCIFTKIRPASSPI